MKKKRGKMLMAAMILASMLSGLPGCGKKPQPAAPAAAAETGSAAQGKAESAAETAPTTAAEAGSAAAKAEEEPVSGARIRKQDPAASRETDSSEIRELDASFVLCTRWVQDEYDNTFRFVIKEDGNGVLTAYEEERSVSSPADEALLSALQEVIAENDLASINGLYDVTAGLAPEYRPGGLTVRYASGGTLTFRTDNDPFALWAEEFYDIFAEWFSGKGIASLYPPKETSPVTMLQLSLTGGGTVTEFWGVNVKPEEAIGGERHLLEKEVYEFPAYKEISEERILFPEDYYERVTGIIAGYDLIRNYDFSAYDRENMNFGNHDRGFCGLGSLRPDYAETDSEDRSLRLYMELENGRRFNIETMKESEIDGAMPLVSELIAYHDRLFKGGQK